MGREVRQVEVEGSRERMLATPVLVDAVRDPWRSVQQNQITLRSRPHPMNLIRRDFTDGNDFGR